MSCELMSQPISTRYSTVGRLPEQTALCRHVAPLSLVCEQLPNFREGECVWRGGQKCVHMWGEVGSLSFRSGFVSVDTHIEVEGPHDTHNSCTWPVAIALARDEQYWNNQATHYCDKYLMFIYHDDALWLSSCASFDAKLEVLMLRCLIFTTIIILF